MSSSYSKTFHISNTFSNLCQTLFNAGVDVLCVYVYTICATCNLSFNLLLRVKGCYMKYTSSVSLHY